MVGGLSFILAVCGGLNLLEIPRLQAVYRTDSRYNIRPLIPVANAPQMSDGFIMAKTADSMTRDVLICDTQPSEQSGRCPTQTIFTSTPLTHIPVKPP